MDLKNKEISWQKVGRRLLSNVKETISLLKEVGQCSKYRWSYSCLRALGPYSNCPHTLDFSLGMGEGLPTKITPHVRQPLIKL